MSDLSAPMQVSSPGLSTITPALEPAFVRNGSTAVKRAYQEALGFEAMLMEQLSKSLAQTGGLGEGSEAGAGESEGAEGASAGEMGLVSSMLPQTLTEAVTRGGGLGLASQLTREIDPSAATAAGSAPVDGAAEPTAPVGGTAVDGAAVAAGGASA
jgi:Rod binding domain-containing protein